MLTNHDQSLVIVCTGAKYAASGQCGFEQRTTTIEQSDPFTALLGDIFF